MTSLAHEAEPDHLLTADDPPPFTLFNAEGPAPLVLLCDHASNAVPKKLAGLGLLERDLNRHIAYDIGAAEITRHMAIRFGAPAVLAGYSRLVIDCNRRLDHETSILAESDATEIPGNAAITPAERRLRIDACFRPYHREIARLLAGFDRRGIVPAIIAVHSFTPVLMGVHRPWHIGVLWNEDGRIATPLIAALRAKTPWTIGDNEPYSGRTQAGHTIEEHATKSGRPPVMLEIREDLVPDTDSARRVADLFCDLLEPILASPSLYTRWTR